MLAAGYDIFRCAFRIFPGRIQRMGYLDWRLWDRLDALDQRVGIEPVYRGRRRPEIVGLILGPLAVWNFVRGRWIMGFIELGLALLIGAIIIVHRLSRRRELRHGDVAD